MVMQRCLLFLTAILAAAARDWRYASVAGEPMKEPVALESPLNSGICGVCTTGQCFSPQGAFRCVRLFDPRRGGIIKNVGCDGKGRFRAELVPGEYVLDRTGLGYPLKNVKNPVAVAVRKKHWIRLDGLTEDDCPDSGIYGWYATPCWGNPPGGSFECLEVFDETAPRLITAGTCERAEPIFHVPLPPGRYMVKARNWPDQIVEIKPHQWLRLGVMEAVPCPPMQ